MELPTVIIAGHEVSRLIVGGNPFSGMSHHSAERSEEMCDYFSVERIKETLRECERCGINTFVGRADNHIMRMLNEYWNDGGTITWVAQTAPERKSVEDNIRAAKAAGATMCYLHGGMVDSMFAAGKTDELRDYIKCIKDAGMPAGTATHNPDVPLYFEEHDFGAEFYMMCFYNLPARSSDLRLRSYDDKFQDEDRRKAVQTIKAVPKPCIGYKILAAGRNDPVEAFRFALTNIKDTDCVAVGFYTKHHPGQVQEDADIFLKVLRETGAVQNTRGLS